MTTEESLMSKTLRFTQGDIMRSNVGQSALLLYYFAGAKALPYNKNLSLRAQAWQSLSAFPSGEVNNLPLIYLKLFLVFPVRFLLAF